MSLTSLEHYTYRPATDHRMSIDFLSSAHPSYRLPPLTNIITERSLPPFTLPSPNTNLSFSSSSAASTTSTSTRTSRTSVDPSTTLPLPLLASPGPEHPPSPFDTSINELLRSHYPRAARPSYPESQKFYIMYARINLEYTWPEIQRGFLARFGKKRSKSGLCSVYYRTRRSWGMEEVLVQVNEGPDAWRRDRQIVCERAWRGGFLRQGEGYN